MYIITKHSQVLAIAMPVPKLAVIRGIIIAISTPRIRATIFMETTHLIMTIFKEPTEILVQDGKTWAKF